MISATIVALLDYFQDPILNALSDVSDEAKNIFKIGLKPYLDSINRRFSKVKTFLHRHENVDFYKTYFPCTLVTSKNPRIPTEDIKELFEETSYLTVIGGAGSGKSMLMRHMFLSCVKHQFLIPVFIELRQLNFSEEGLVEYIYQLLLANRIAANEKILRRILNSGKFLFLLDGYDEIFSEKKNIVTNDINAFVDLYQNNKFVITSRPGANIELLPRFDNFYVNKLSGPEIKAFIKKQLAVYKKDDWEELAERMVANIEHPDNKSYKFFMRNPLLLSMFILYFENNPEVPKKKSSFYANVFAALCIQHNALSKQGFTHEKQSGLSNDQIESVLKIFSFYTYFKGEYLFSTDRLKFLFQQIERNEKTDIQFETQKLINDLILAIPIFIKDGLNYMYPHRSLQEYFAASFIVALSEQQKVTLYEQRLRELCIRGADSYANFWSLCLELDKKAFLKHFAINALKGFLQKIKHDTDEDIVFGILRIIDLSLTIEFFQHQKYEFDDNVKYQGDDSFYKLIKYVDADSGEIRKSSWAEDFDYYINIFKFFGILKFYELIESIHPYKLFSCCNHKLSKENIKVFDETPKETQQDDDIAKELTEMSSIKLVFGDKIEKAFSLGTDSSLIVCEIKLSKVFAHQEEVKLLMEESDLGDSLLQLYDDVEAKIEELETELNKDRGFNDDLLEEIL